MVLPHMFYLVLKSNETFYKKKKTTTAKHYTFMSLLTAADVFLEDLSL